MNTSLKVRLQKFIADCGVTSRRKAEDLIVQGRVKVNGILATVLGTKVNPQEDVVTVDGELIDMAMVSRVYLLMNKPRGYVTTLDDPEGRKTVMDLCKEVSERIYPVGRLDYLSEGLLILTNDGEVANMIMHPSHNIQKVYEVKIFGAVSLPILSKLREGFVIEGTKVRPEAVRVIKQLKTKTWLEFRLREGKNREIRRICEAAGLTIDKLKRVAIANLSVDDIRPGSYMFITKIRQVTCKFLHFCYKNALFLHSLKQ
jgi:23S rRNA pseudouridine2605 synthase